MTHVTDLPSTPAAERCDVAVIGAGPGTGLSTAAHLLGKGLSVAVFGKPLEFWRQHMPKGMLLRSHWWATNLSDPDRQYRFDRFLRSSAEYHHGYPVPLDAFIRYGTWFQQHVVPHVDHTYVCSVNRRDGRFHLTLADGRSVESGAVVMAVGLRYYANRPEQYAHLSPAFVSHACDHHDLGVFSSQRVVVVGGGQSAIESAALLHESGATVHIVSRRPIEWLERDRTAERTLVERMLAPSNGLAPGWINWLMEKRPYDFYRLSQRVKDRQNGHWTATAAAWLRDRVVGKATLHERSTIDSAARPSRDGVVLTLADGLTMHADHVLLATGYSVDVRKLVMLDPSLRAAIRTEKNIPLLNHWFESSVPGLYFVGLSSMYTFGPLFRFVAGCPAASGRVAVSVARRAARRRRSIVDVGRESAFPHSRQTATGTFTPRA